MVLNNIFKKIIFIILFSLFNPLAIYAQNKSDKEELRKILNQDKYINIDRRREPTKFDLSQIDLSLRQRKYDLFFTLVSDVKANSELINFLEGKVQSGHVPIYWMLADIHARDKSGLDAHKWLYVATIMTEQDIALCGDKSVNDYTKKILKSMPDTVYYTRSTPFYIKEAMTKTYEFISNISDRQPPDWVCSLKDPTIKSKSKPLSKSKWNLERRKILEKYASEYKPKITSQDVFRDLENKEKFEKELERAKIK